MYVCYPHLLCRQLTPSHLHVEASIYAKGRQQGLIVQAFQDQLVISGHLALFLRTGS